MTNIWNDFESKVRSFTFRSVNFRKQICRVTIIAKWTKVFVNLTDKLKERNRSLNGPIGNSPVGSIDRLPSGISDNVIEWGILVVHYLHRDDCSSSLRESYQRNITITIAW
jgi:hypothetical protein